MTAPPVALVATDLDGTLWDRDGRIHPRTADALARLRARGVPVLTVTGRRPATAAPLLRANGLTPAASVYLDGALGREGTDGNVFHRSTLDPGTVTALLALCHRHGVEPCVVVDGPDHDLLIGEQPSTHPRHLAANAARIRRCDLAAEAPALPVLSLVVCGGDPRPLTALAARTTALARTSLTRDTVYGGAALSLRRPGTGKWQAVRAYCARSGLDPAGVLALGDGANDLDLLSEAAVALVPADGDPAALAHATATVAPASRGGWADVLEYLP